MFTVTKPEQNLVVGDIVTYRCEAHRALYDDLRIIYNDGSSIYERAFLDRAWRSRDNRQSPQPDIDWNVPVKPSRNSQTMVIEVKTRPLTKNRIKGYFQCIARSKQSDAIPDAKDKYTISVGGKFKL